MRCLRRLGCLVAGVVTLLPWLLPAPAEAEVWNRTRPDGTVESGNLPPGTGNAPARGGDAGAGVGAGAGTFWVRERRGGVVEFTNARPVGASWRVWLKTGPGKASALRGATDVVPPRDTSAARYSRYDRDIQDQQLYFGIPEALIRAVVKVESDFDPRVVSSAGAKGLMQLMPDTARLMGVTDVFDPRQNVMAGARYLQVLARRFCRTPAAGSRAGEAGGAGRARRADDQGGNQDGRGAGGALICSDAEKVKVLAGYHAGPAAVERYGGLPPYETTRAYVTNVLRRFEEYRRSPAAHAGAYVTER